MIDFIWCLVGREQLRSARFEYVGRISVYFALSSHVILETVLRVRGEAKSAKTHKTKEEGFFFLSFIFFAKCFHLKVDVAAKLYNNQKD